MTYARITFKRVKDDMNTRPKNKRGKSRDSVMDSGYHLAAVLETVGEGIVTIDSVGTVIMVNREVLPTCGRPIMAVFTEVFPRC